MSLFQYLYLYNNNVFHYLGETEFCRRFLKIMALNDKLTPLL